MVASIPGHQAPAGHVLTAVNIPQKHAVGQRPIAPHGIAIQHTAQGTPMVIQVSAAPPAAQGKPTLVQAATTVKTAASGATLVPQSGSNESLKAPISAAPKMAQASQGRYRTCSESWWSLLTFISLGIVMILNYTVHAFVSFA